MSKKSDARYAKQMMRRIARAEAAADATILRAFDRMMRTLEHEKAEWQIRLRRRDTLKQPTLPAPEPDRRTE